MEKLCRSGTTTHNRVIFPSFWYDLSKKKFDLRYDEQLISDSVFPCVNVNKLLILLSMRVHDTNAC